MKSIIVQILIVVLVLGAIVLVFSFGSQRDTGLIPSEPVACTLDAKICPDGSAVGRVGPNCEFAACPVAPAPNKEWKVTTNGKQGVTYQYPDNFGTVYISIVDWPPQARVLDEVFSCIEAGTQTDQAGGTKRKIIAGREFCVTTTSEGAAGSVYTTYEYAFTKPNRAKEDKTVIFTFSLRATSCSNFDETEKRECEAERSTFSPDSIIAEMAEKLQFLVFKF